MMYSYGLMAIYTMIFVSSIFFLYNVVAVVGRLTNYN